MKVIRPVVIDSGKLVSSSVPEDEHQVWNSGTTYAAQARVIADHFIYESLQAGNLNKPPAASLLDWVRIGPTNQWAMFDAEISTQTAADGELTVVLKPGYVNSLALFGVSGSNLAVEARDGADGPVIYSHEQSLDGSFVGDWYQYFYEPIEQLDEVVLQGLPAYADAHLTLTISGLVAACGILIVGNVYEIGRTQRGASAGITDYSRKETSAAGTTTFVKRRYSKRMRASMVVGNALLNKLQRLLASLRATPCVWIGTDAPGYQPLTVFGFYRDFSIDIAYSNHSLCNLEIEGLT
ncbi:MAG TPA: hypothetical protein VIM12_05915 [Noviherbaspirillum sp.]|jgi:hypothetical protein|uniref:hypothetical protein n=1 Tax=Noviherbaspirillum sp. TaxID=1926288 RepID=UPI002F93014C